MLRIFLVKGVGDCSRWRYHYLFMLGYGDGCLRCCGNNPVTGTAQHFGKRQSVPTLEWVHD
ncbi:hypothetical protein XF_0555 [Xylella fastidiosa 9a5c]|uniref:Uncharacterized protein n=1 Tax=Xylella fastidiosa (strain 9a5c) TaxID=160492 RepID=Q9PFV2_XYLFA|nr:hypothetical protein XF_0555 [Xylella fastidiosa 9a5c]